MIFDYVETKCCTAKEQNQKYVDNIITELKKLGCTAFVILNDGTWSTSPVGEDTYYSYSVMGLKEQSK